MKKEHIDYLYKNWATVMSDVEKPSKAVLNSMAYPCPGCQMNYYDIKYGVAGGWISRDCYLPNNADIKARFEIYGTATSGEGHQKYTKTEVIEKPKDWEEGKSLPEVLFWRNAKIIDPNTASENRANFARANDNAAYQAWREELDPLLQQQAAAQRRGGGGKRTRRRRKRKRKSRRKRRKRR
tara:strand:+ start:74 stop:619 length:546 start_codon:yes stop_codon:yes gene_type:complete